MFSIRSIFIFLFATISMAIGCGSHTFSLATGNNDSSFNLFGNMITNILVQSGIPTKIEVSEGSVNNIELLRDNKVDLALVQNDVAFYAENGIEMFKDNPVQNLRGIATLYPLSCHIITLASSTVNSVDDLRGKRISVGGVGRADVANARQILAAYGMTYDDVEVFHFNQKDSFDALKNGQIAATFLTTISPANFITEFAFQNPIRLIPIRDDLIDSLTKIYPYYTRTVMQSGIYPGVEVDVPSVSVKAMLVTTNRMYSDDIYNITRAIFQNSDRFNSVHTSGKTIRKDYARSGMSIQMHTGANRFFNE